MKVPPPKNDIDQARAVMKDIDDGKSVTIDDLLSFHHLSIATALHDSRRAYFVAVCGFVMGAVSLALHIFGD